MTEAKSLIPEEKMVEIRKIDGRKGRRKLLELLNYVVNIGNEHEEIELKVMNTSAVEGEIKIRVEVESELKNEKWRAHNRGSLAVLIMDIVYFLSTYETDKEAKRRQKEKLEKENRLKEKVRPIKGRIETLFKVALKDSADVSLHSRYELPNDMAVDIRVRPKDGSEEICSELVGFFRNDPILNVYNVYKDYRSVEISRTDEVENIEKTLDTMETVLSGYFQGTDSCVNQ